MKKNLLLIAVLLWTGALAFGETGYKKSNWYESKNKTLTKVRYSMQRELDPEEYEVYGNSLVIETSIILGEQNEIYYNYIGDMLSAITYVINSEKTKELTKKYNNLVTKIKINSMEKKAFIDIVNEDFLVNHFNISFCNIIANQAIGAEIEGYETLNKLNEPSGIPSEKKDGGLISIYDYNDDTRVYIFENYIEGQTVVVYVPHEQDY